MKKLLMGFLTVFAAMSLAACAEESKEVVQTEEHTGHAEETTDHSAHSGMDHSGSGELPEGLKNAENPTFPVGTKAMMHADHMEGMDGAEATIVGAFSTTVYAVSYTPVNGGDPVTNHKWVIHEEIDQAGTEPFEKGAEVVLNADHMDGMKGATATIDSAEETTVYMVDYTSTTGEVVTNHKWVTENELTTE
ncbi:YdhK family protein [Lysinibacillus antri]|uniref:DUF1541 domain-containing protein n=1 Tax=Lysinibacillus antri TaxID=2498145 RepID=A0A432L9P8_9BACI|nr:YdhK family protein [Lysinibacillus antri]RUL50757.1 DUF1541 domain-containing protein [Lysinibacillus antri]